MNLQEKRLQAGIEQADLAQKVGTNAPMMSNFEHYKCLPIPSMLARICAELKCDVLDIYKKDEIYCKAKSTATTTKNSSDIYNLQARLPNKAREVLTPENLRLLGYRNITDFINRCYLKFERKLMLIKQKKNAAYQNTATSYESGTHTK